MYTMYYITITSYLESLLGSGFFYLFNLQLKDNYTHLYSLENNYILYEPSKWFNKMDLHLMKLYFRLNMYMGIYASSLYYFIGNRSGKK